MAAKLVGQDGTPVKYQGKEVFSSDYSGVVKSVDMMKRTLVMTGTDETKDRDGDIIRLSGWNMDNYKKNPVFLWAHNYGSVPLARAEKVTKKKEPPRMEFLLQFPTKGIYPFADMILELYEEKIINASSVGFIPMKWNPIEEDKNDDNRRNPYGREYIGQELLELSGCAVPSNPSAVQNALKGKNFGFKDDDLLKYLTGATLIPRPEKEDDIIDELDKSETEIVDETTIQVQVAENLNKSEDDVTLTIAPEVVEEDTKISPPVEEVVEDPPEGEKEMTMDMCGSGDLPINPDSSWDGKAAIARMKELCGGPDKDKMNWEKYGKGFVMRDGANKESFGSYKLPFADVKDGKLTAVWGGVMRAMSAVHGARGGMNASDVDKKKAHNFLAGYYKKFDKPVPEMTSVFDVEELMVDFSEEIRKIKEELFISNQTLESMVAEIKGIQDSLAKALEEIQRKPKSGNGTSDFILKEAFNQGRGKAENPPTEKYSKESLDSLRLALVEVAKAMKNIKL